MSGEAAEETKPGSDKPEEQIKPDLAEAKFLWDEYRYRHELCWKLIFQITAAVVAILIVPYIKADITKLVGAWIVTLPALAIVLVLFSMSRLKRELDILDKIRAAHRKRQEKVQTISYMQSGSAFTRDVMLI